MSTLRKWELLGSAMNFDQLIENWHTKATDEDYFSKFVFEYLAFVAYLKRKKFTEARKDRHAIQKLKQDHATRDLYVGKINNDRDLKEAWQNIKEELERSRLGNVSRNSDEVEEIIWWNCSHDLLEERTGEENKKLKGVIHSLDDWENMVEFWCSIRNNLFHGSKDPQDERDQLLVENGYKTLRPLVQILLVHK